MQFRRFNEMGLKAFREYLDALRQNPTAPPPLDLLEKPSLTEVLDPPIEATPVKFANRMAFAKWLHDAAQQAGTEIPRRDAGFWGWLTLALFDEVCPPDKQGHRSVKEDPRYLPMLDTSRRYYRHSLVGPYNVYLLYEQKPERAAALLCGTLSKLTDEAYRLFVENQLVFYPSAVSVLSYLFFDMDKNSLKRGSQSKSKPGSIRRLARVLTQYARTFDLDVVPVSALAAILPNEFEQWRAGSASLFEHTF